MPRSQEAQVGSGRLEEGIIFDHLAISCGLSTSNKDYDDDDDDDDDD